MVIHYPNPILKTPCQSVSVFDDKLQAILDQMDIDVVYEGGEALAANQVGISQRIFVVSPEFRDPTVPRWIINPEIIDPVGSVRCIEGCLSIPGLKAWRNRYESFTLKYQDEKGVEKLLPVNGFYAIVCQHEIDHLNGKLFIEDLDPVEYARIANKLNKFRKKK